MLAGQSNGLAEAQAMGFEETTFRGRAFALVGDQNDRPARPPQPVGKVLVERRDAGTGIDEEEHRFGLFHGAFGLLAHAPFQALRRHFLESRRIDDPEVQVEQPALPLAPVAGDAGPLVDDGQAPPHQAVKERRLADVGAADQGHGGSHIRSSNAVLAASARQSAQRCQ